MSEIDYEKWMRGEADYALQAGKKLKTGEFVELKEYGEVVGVDPSPARDGSVVHCGRISLRYDWPFGWIVRGLRWLAERFETAADRVDDWCAEEDHVRYVHESWTEPAPSLEKYRGAIDAMVKRQHEFNDMSDPLKYVGVAQAVDPADDTIDLERT